MGGGGNEANEIIAVKVQERKMRLKIEKYQERGFVSSREREREKERVRRGPQSIFFPLARSSNPPTAPPPPVEKKKF